MSRSRWQSQWSNQDNTMTLQTYTPNQCQQHVSTFYTLQFSRYSPGKILKVRAIAARSKVKSRSHHDIAYLHPQPMSQPSIDFLHPIISKIKPHQDFKVKGTIPRPKVKSRSHHDAAHLHPQPMFPHTMKLLYLMVFEISPRQDNFFPATQLPTRTPARHHG